MEVDVRRKYIHIHTHLRLVKFKSLLDKQGKIPFIQLDMCQEIKEKFGGKYVHIGFISILIERQGKGLHS